jgi:hypothetical protein
MKAVKCYLLLVLITGIFVGCDLFFPYKLEDIPVIQEVEVPEGGFSVARNACVYFSSGNLQYHAGMDQWRFAPNQYDYIGYRNYNINSSYNDWIDLFGWGTGDDPTSQYTKSSFIDWGVNRIGNYEEGTWRTLTIDEVSYILKSRNNASSLIGCARVADVNGLILLPDAWNCPSGVTFKSGFDVGFSQNVYSVSKWKLMEEAGAVFLPAAGRRDGSNVIGVQDIGCYWSATESYGSAYYLRFYSDEASIDHFGCDYGISVRLVKDL